MESGAIATVDWAIAAIALISVGVGTLRGLVREAMSLAVWLIAFLVAGLFAHALAQTLADRIAVESLRFPVAFGSLFIGVLIVGSLITRLMGALVHAVGLTGLDRMLGALFGAARALVLLVVAAAMLDPLFADSSWWQASVLIPSLLDAQDRTFEVLRSILALFTGSG